LNFTPGQHDDAPHQVYRQFAHRKDWFDLWPGGAPQHHLHRLETAQDHSFENQSYGASGLNLVLAAIALWNTIFFEQVIEQS
jgi:hypothetical protein